METVVEARELTRHFGELLAVDHVNFAIRRAEIFGLLGPNGAGKTTTVRMLTGVIFPSEGTALIDSHDVVREAVAAREHIGTVPEEANVYVDLTVWQNLMLMGELHGVRRPRRTQRGKELLTLFGLSERAKQKGRALSKGLRQRLMLCMALVSHPTVLFLDEPTTGLDVASARLIRELVVRLNREQGMTIFLTTHNIKEADELCHRIGIINKGRIATVDTPAALRGQFEALHSVEVTFRERSPDAETLSGLDEVINIRPLARGFRVFTAQPGRVAQEIACLARESGTTIESIRTSEPALEDVFLRITESSPTQEERGHD
jgi:ABC-2 type transport system ATP-binding protein